MGGGVVSQLGGIYPYGRGVKLSLVWCILLQYTASRLLPEAKDTIPKMAVPSPSINDKPAQYHGPRSHRHKVNL